jgi:hypothetical protein
MLISQEKIPSEDPAKRNMQLSKLVAPGLNPRPTFFRPNILERMNTENGLEKTGYTHVGE